MSKLLRTQSAEAARDYWNLVRRYRGGAFPPSPDRNYIGVQSQNDKLVPLLRQRFKSFHDLTERQKSA